MNLSAGSGLLNISEVSLLSLLIGRRLRKNIAKKLIDEREVIQKAKSMIGYKN